MTMQLIESRTLATATSSIVFSSIPQDGTDLLLCMSLRSAGAGVSQINIQFNSSGGTAYIDRFLQGTGSISQTGSRTGQSVMRITAIPGASYTSQTFGNAQAYIANYSGTAAKSVSMDGVTENNSSESIQEIVAAYWTNTSAITSITLTNQSGDNFVARSMASLYKITKGSGGATVS